MEKIKFFLRVKPHVSILSIPFVILLLLQGVSIIVILLPITFYIIERKFDLSKTFIYSFFIFLLYCQIIYDDTKFNIHDLRLRYFSIFFIFLSIVINFFLLKKRELIYFVNVFVLFFSLNILLFNFISTFYNFNRDTFLNKLDFKYNSLNLKINKSDNPLILIVLDEFSSTSEIFNITNDSIDYKLDVFLKSKGFTVYNKSITKTKRTSLSLPSIFNFNLHNSFKNDSIEKIDKGFQKLSGFDEIFTYNLLVDSLNLKSVNSNSYGLLPFKNGINDPDFYYYWTDRFPSISIFKSIIKKTILGTYLEGENRETKNIDDFRKQSLERMVNLKPLKNNFYYFHLFFPHDPYSFFEEYPNRDLNFITISESEYLEEHIKYKRWFVDKLIDVFDDLSFKNSRIIITGDHGFRYNKLINPELTNIYFKGFPIEVSKKINNVQDLGYLINESF